MSIVLSPFTMEAYHEVMALWKACEGVGLSDADSEQNTHSYFVRNPGMSFVARQEGTLVGAVLCGHDGRRGYIHHLAVHPTCRRQGIGRRLVERCLSSLRAVGIQKCNLFIFNTNVDGIAFWKRLGWTQRSDISVMSKVLDECAAFPQGRPPSQGRNDAA